MSDSNQTQRRIEDYLARVRKGLRILSDETARDIVAELRSHIVEKAEVDGEMLSARVDAALASLGPPGVLARQYVTDDALARAEVSRAPWTILGGVFHWATLSATGFLTLLICAIGYMFGAAFLIAALVKPFNPRAGLWLMNDGSYSLALGFTDAAVRGRELLGWLLIPIGFSVGGGAILLTTQFALWSIRRFRQAQRIRRSPGSAR